jgi:hypothetical protein
MKVVRKITYESDDEEMMRRQLAHCLPAGHTLRLAVDITIEHLEGPELPTRDAGWYPKPQSPDPGEGL